MSLRPPIRSLGRAPGWLGPLLLAAAVGGCREPSESLAAVQSQLRSLRQENASLTADLAKLRQLVAEQQTQIDALRGLGPKRLELLFTVTKVELGRYTAAADLDGKGGDDGVRVYLRPIDRDGHPIKAAGSVTVRLFDLAEPTDNLLAGHEFPVEKIAEHWMSGLASYHYRFDCPWGSRPPRHPEVTVRVTFTDYLTGRTFTAQRLCKVKPAPGAE